MSALSIFNPKVDSPDLPQYGEQAITTLLAHYGAEKPAETLLGEPTNREAVITSDITTEWKTYRQLLVNKPENNMKLHLKELVCNDMMRTLFPNLCKIATISLSIPVSTASVERSFSHTKLIKTRLRSSLNDKSLSHLMRIAIESPAEITDNHLEEVVDVLNRKNRRIGSSTVIVHVCGIIVSWFFVVLYAHVSLVSIKRFWEKLFSTDVVATGIERLIVG